MDLLAQAAAPVDVPSPWTSWSWDPIQLLVIAVFTVLYLRRARRLAKRGQPVSGWRQLSFYLGMLMMFIAVASPIHRLGEHTFLFMHMIQHVLVGDLAPLAIVAGLTGPVLRPLLAVSAINRLRVLGHPLVALPLWAVNLYVWHLPSLYEGALHHDAVHAIQHLLFFAFGALMWATILEPLPGPAWFGTGSKLMAMVGVRLATMILGNVIAWSGGVFYSTYDHAPVWGITARSDQGTAGSVMMVVDAIVTICLLAWLFLRLGSEQELRQRLIEAGVDETTASRAVRYGRGRELIRESSPASG